MKRLFQFRKRRMVAPEGQNSAMATRLTLRIQERRSRLTPTEQKLAALLIENQTLIETHSATEIAALSGVSKATAARFFRNLGYTDFDEAKTQAREERNRTQPYAYSPGPERVTPGRALAEHLELEIANLTRTFEEMRSDTLTEAARLIVDAPRLWCLGLGAEDGLARLARTTFARLRPNVHLIAGQGGWAEDLAMTGPRDVLLLLTLDPRRRAVRALAGHARTTRMAIVTLTDAQELAAARRWSTLAIGCHAATYARVPSHTAALSMLRLLAVAVLAEAGEPALQRGALVEQINEELGLEE